MSEAQSPGNTKDRSFTQANELLNSSFQYCLLDNADAAYLVNLLDDLVYECLVALDEASDVVQTMYMSLVYHSLRKQTKKTFSTVNDKYASYYAHLTGRPLWLYGVRRYVRIYRAYWVSLLTDFVDSVPSILAQLEEPSSIAVDDRKPVTFTLLGTEFSLPYLRAYGVCSSIMARWPRIKDVERRITVPFLRRVGTLARNFAREPNTFEEHYQHGFEGVLIALSKYDPEQGSFASQVNMWVANRMIHSIKQSNSFIRIPDRMYKLRVLVDKHRKHNPNASLDDIAVSEGVDAKALEAAVVLHDRQNIAPLIDDLDDDEPEAYTDYALEIDREASDVAQQVDFYTRNLTQSERVLLFLVYDYDAAFPPFSEEGARRRVELETFRQLAAVLG